MALFKTYEGVYFQVKHLHLSGFELLEVTGGSSDDCLSITGKKVEQIVSRLEQGVSPDKMFDTY